MKNHLLRRIITLSFCLILSGTTIPVMANENIIYDEDDTSDDDGEDDTLIIDGGTADDDTDDGTLIIDGGTADDDSSASIGGDSSENIIPDFGAITGRAGDDVTWTLTGNVHDGYTMSFQGEGTLSEADDTYPYRRLVDYVVIGDGITGIGENVFKDWSDLTDVTIPSSVNTIGERAFEGSGLENLILSSGLKYISAEAFKDCSNLKKVVLPDTVEEIGGWAFAQCYDLTDVTLPENVCQIDSCAFYRTSISSIEFSDKNCNIDNDACDEIYYLGSQTLKPNKEFKVYGYPGSTAETFANNNGFTFVDIQLHHDPAKNGIIEGTDGKKYYMVDGEIQTSVTDVKEVGDKWWNIVNGIVVPDTVSQNEYGWWYIGNEGSVDLTYTGIAKNENGWWRIVDGKVDFSCTSVEKNENGWWVLENGKVDFTANGLYQNQNGWWYCQNGKVNFSYYGITTYQGDTWLIMNGTINRSTGVYKVGYNWYYFKNGKLQTSYTGIKSNSYGWWRIVRGKVDFNANGLYKNEYGWWYCRGGMVRFNYYGLATNSYGTWLVLGGKVQFQRSGRWYGRTIRNGKAY